jgi:putative transposase
VRQSFFEECERPSAPETDKLFRMDNPELYKTVSTAPSQRIG